MGMPNKGYKAACREQVVFELKVFAVVLILGFAAGAYSWLV